ncbi:MAG TPA: hypothetical protein VIP78_09655 [Candidatus Dormibacteraeota bacterium]|jgi:GNAT superfamily N-acetyltransferase
MFTAVHTIRRGGGVATLLLKRMIAEADLAGVSTIHGENEDDPRLNTLYESAGVKVRTYRQSPDGRRKVEMSMTVKLAMAMLATDPDFEAAVHEAARYRACPLLPAIDGSS